MKKLLTIFLASLLSLLVFVQPSYAESSVWKVSNGKDHFYLAGTIHLLPESQHPLPAEFHQAYKKADHIILETVLDETAQPKLFAAMMLPPGQKLSSQLSPDVYQKLSEHIKGRKMPMQLFSAMKPFGVSLALSVTEYQLLGFKQELGVDSHFENQAKKDSKKVSGLETIDQQIAFLSALETVEADTIINYTLRDLKQLSSFIKPMMASWRTGDIKAMENDPQLKSLQADFPIVVENLLTKRNHNWMKKLPKLLNNSQKELVMVGALHLVGKDGLLQLLQKKGFSVSQI